MTTPPAWTPTRICSSRSARPDPHCSRLTRLNGSAEAARCERRASRGRWIRASALASGEVPQRKSGAPCAEPGIRHRRRPAGQAAEGAFEGNMAETGTMLPVIEAFMTDCRLPDVTVLADAGMISEANQKAIRPPGCRSSPACASRTSLRGRPVAPRAPRRADPRRARLCPAMAGRGLDGQSGGIRSSITSTGTTGPAAPCVGSTSRPPKPRKPSPGGPRRHYQAKCLVCSAAEVAAPVRTDGTPEKCVVVLIIQRRTAAAGNVRIGSVRVLPDGNRGGNDGGRRAPWRNRNWRNRNWRNRKQPSTLARYDLNRVSDTPEKRTVLAEEAERPARQPAVGQS